MDNSSSHPLDAAGLLAQARSLQQNGQWSQSEKPLRRALELDPKLAAAHHHLGLLLYHTGRGAQAIDAMRACLRLCDDDCEAHYNIGVMLAAQDRQDEAAVHFQRAIERKPDHVQAHINLALARHHQGRLEEALRYHRAAQRLAPGDVNVHINLGRHFWSIGENAQAIEFYRAALQLDPTHNAAASNLIVALNYAPGKTPCEIHQAHIDWARRFADPLTALAPPHPNPRDPRRRLRIGFVSPDFHDHPIAYFIEPILANLNRTQFEVFCYSNRAADDAVTARLRALADRWRNIDRAPDDQAADEIRRDGIDILVDLSGHTAGNRLLLFARKPAPIQITHFGYPNTTGMRAMDYRITDPFCDPPGETDRFSSEKLLRLPHVAWCYNPLGRSPDVGPLAALTNGFVTFGSFNNPAKLNNAVLATWGEILRRLPTSRLVILGIKNSERVLEQLRSAGAKPNQVELISKLSRPEYLALHNRVDVALDPFPYNGGVTTCDALHMGVPVLTLAGDSYVSRQGAMLLTAMKLPELIVRTPADYVDRAAALAADIPKLAALRGTLRQRLRESPVMSWRTYTDSLARAYRSAWRQYCANSVSV